MPTITVPLAPRLTRLGRGREHNAIATDTASEQAGDASMAALQGDESDALVEQAAHSVRQAATLAAICLLTMAIVGGAAVVLSRRAVRARASKS
jgi:hypothetical protein